MTVLTKEVRKESVTRPSPPRTRRPSVGRWILLFLTPTIILFGAYTVWPSLASIWYSLLDWRSLGGQQEFVGDANYVKAFADPLFWRSLGNTMLIIIVTVPIRVGLALLLALLLNDRRLPLSKVFRSAFFLPVIATTAIIGIVMQFVLDPSAGPVNTALGMVGVAPIDFLGDSSTALPSVMAVHIWKWLGITLMYWLAALQTVPEELQEAGQLDGAGPWQRFRHITLPLLMPFLVIISLLTVIETMQIFDLVQTMTGGGPFFSTLVTEVYIYEQAFASSNPRLGYGSAIGVLFGVVTLLVVAIQAIGTRLATRRSGASS